MMDLNHQDMERNGETGLIQGGNRFRLEGSVLGDRMSPTCVNPVCNVGQVTWDLVVQAPSMNRVKQK